MAISKDFDSVKKRIQACLELAANGNNSESERTLAMDRAKELMLKYTMSEYDLARAKDEALTIVTEEYNHEAMGKQGVKEVSGSIMALIAELFGVRVIEFTKEHKILSTFKLVGFPHNVEIARYALDVIYQFGLEEARRKFRSVRTVNFGMSFWSGYYQGLVSKFFVPRKEDEGIVVYDKVNEHLNSLGLKEGQREKLTNGPGYAAGRESGLAAEIRKGIGNTQNQGRLLV